MRVPLGPALCVAGYALAVVTEQDPALGAEAGRWPPPGSLDEADAVVASAVGQAFPGAVLEVGIAGPSVHLKAFGRTSYEPDAADVRPDTIYDLASLTKVVVTTTIAMTLFDEGKLQLEAPVSSFLPRFRGGSKDRVTVRQLLTHSAGLRWWAPLYQQVSGERAFLERIVAMDLSYEPGTKSVYSDLGIVLLGGVLEKLGGAPLEEMGRRRVLGPLGMADTLYRPPMVLRSRIAPTEPDPWRGRLLWGEVHDENAFALGGAAAHAGLFGTAPDLGRFARMMLEGGTLEGRRLVSRSTIELFTTRDSVPGSTRALGWDTASAAAGSRSSVPGDPGYCSAGTLLSSRSFGHTGFTGTSLWIDPERKAFVILLTNRVHPRPEELRRGGRGRDNEAIRGVRSRVADAVARALDRP